MTAWTSLIAETITPGPSQSPTGPPIDENLISPGLLGFLSFVFLIVAVVLLYRSMQKQLKKVDPKLPEGPSDALREEDRRIIAEAEERGAQSRRSPGTEPGPGGPDAG